MKKLLILAAVAAMVMGAKADYTFTLNLPGAKAVYKVYAASSEKSKEEIAGQWERSKAMLFNEAFLQGKDWADYYAALEENMSSHSAKFSGSEGSFSLSDASIDSWGLLVLTDATELSPGAAYAVYYGTDSGEGGPITLDKTPIETGFLMGGSPAPVPEPTSGLLLLLGVAGLALKRKRA